MANSRGSASTLAPTAGVVSGMLSGVKIVPVSTAAYELNVSVRRVQQFCEEGRLGSKVNGNPVITRAELDAFKEIPREPGRPPGK